MNNAMLVTSEKLEKAIQCTKKYGELLACRQLSTIEADDYLGVVLVKRTTRFGIDYITWEINFNDDGGIFWGHYDIPDLKSACDDYNDRINPYGKPDSILVIGLNGEPVHVKRIEKIIDCE